jgi:hypothetical protein
MCNATAVACLNTIYGEVCIKDSIIHGPTPQSRIRSPEYTKAPKIRHPFRAFSRVLKALTKTFTFLAAKRRLKMILAARLPHFLLVKRKTPRLPSP